MGLIDCLGFEVAPYTNRNRDIKKVGAIIPIEDLKLLLILTVVGI